MPDPKITVIVPTRERCDVLEKCLRTLTTQQYANLDIIVSDNCSADCTERVVRDASDPRIRYLRTERRVSMTQNWEFALRHVTDGWVSFIGDDDGLPPRAIERVARLISETGCKTIRSRFSTFEWPALTGRGYGYLLTPLGNRMRMRCSAEWLARVMNGQAKYTELPMLYNGGYVHMSVLEHIRTRTGAYFRSSSPDVYSAVAIASVTDEYLHTDEPLAISGTSRHSTGNSFYSSTPQRDSAPSLRFSQECNIPFHPDLPLTRDGSYPLSLHALAYEAYLQSTALRPNTVAIADRAAQLEIIMATAGVHSHSIADWGHLYAEMHGLDYRRARRGAFFRGLYLKPLAFFRKLRHAARCIATGSPEVPLHDIYEASIAAAMARHPAGRISTWIGILGSALGQKLSAISRRSRDKRQPPLIR